MITEWIFGEFLCKAMPYIQAVSVSASVYTLVAVALERYAKIGNDRIFMCTEYNNYI